MTILMTICNYANKIVKQILKETRDKMTKAITYNKHIDKEIVSADISDTLIDLLTAISPKFGNQLLQSLMIGSIVTSVVTNQTTPL